MDSDLKDVRWMPASEREKCLISVYNLKKELPGIKLNTECLDRLKRLKDNYDGYLALVRQRNTSESGVIFIDDEMFEIAEIVLILKGLIDG